MLGFIGVNPAMFGARLMLHSLSKYTVSNQREASIGAPGDSSRRPMLFSYDDDSAIPLMLMSLNNFRGGSGS